MVSAGTGDRGELTTIREDPLAASLARERRLREADKPAMFFCYGRGGVFIGPVK